MSTPRTLRRQRASRRRRIFALLAGLLAVLLVGMGVWALFLRGASEEDTGPSGTKVTIEAGEVVSETVGEPATFPDDQRDLVVEKVHDYVERATVEPLRTAQPARKLDAIFDPGALAAVQGPDGVVLLDQGLPEVTGKLTAVSEPVAINALADESGAWIMASARLELRVKGGTDDGSLRIMRRGELLFVPEDGDWKVTAFDIFVERKGPGIDSAQGATR